MFENLLVGFEISVTGVLDHLHAPEIVEKRSKGSVVRN